MEDAMTPTEFKQLMSETLESEALVGKEVSILQLYSAACAALRINNEYVKAFDKREDKASNSNIIRFLLVHRPDLVTEKDNDEGAAMLEYIQGKLVELVAGHLEDYWQRAVMMTEQKTYRTSDYKDIAFIASMPSSYFNAQQRDDVNNELALLSENSSHVGKIGETYVFVLRILGAVFSKNYVKWYHTAVTDNGNLVRFPLSHKLERGHWAEISGKVHRHADSNTTTLHYVRVKKTLDIIADDATITT
jgi:hypothetical protein